MTYEEPSPITSMPGKVTNKQLFTQGWNAAVAGRGYTIDDCPYYATSTAEKHWKAGYRSAGS